MSNTKSSLDDSTNKSLSEVSQVHYLYSNRITTDLKLKEEKTKQQIDYQIDQVKNIHNSVLQL